MNKRGMAGMFIIIVVLLGVIAWVFQNNIRESSLLLKEAKIHEIRSNRISALRNVIEKSYVRIEPKNRAAWMGAIQEKLGPMYRVEIAFNTDSTPPYGVIEDRTYGMISYFYLSSGRS